MNNNLMFSSKSDNWETPQDLFDALDNEFHFDLDVCACHHNAKCDKYITPDIDGLAVKWIGRVWCNLPYGRDIYKWVAKASFHDDLVVMLLPSRTDTKWFHDFIYHNPRVELRFIRGRLKFGGCSNPAPFPSLIAIFRN